MSTLLQHYTRTPTETVEAIWRPAAGDFEMIDPSEANAPVIRDRKQSLTVAWAGLPAGVGLTVEMTAIYEWIPVPGLGASTNATGKARSRNSIDDILDYAIERGEKFVRFAGMSMVDYASRTMASQVARVFGVIPALPTRNSTRLLSN